MRISFLRIALVMSLLSSVQSAVLAADLPLRVVDAVASNLVILRENDHDVIVQLLGVGGAPNPSYHPYESVLYLRHLLNGQNVYLQYDASEQRNTHGRRVGYLFRSGDGEFINLRMISDGYATCSSELSSEYRGVFLRHQAIAQKSNRGLWTQHRGSERWETDYKNVRFLGQLSYEPKPEQRREVTSSRRQQDSSPVTKPRKSVRTTRKK